MLIITDILLLGGTPTAQHLWNLISVIFMCNMIVCVTSSSVIDIYKVTTKIKVMVDGYHQTT